MACAPPKAGEDKNKFISRCIASRIKEGDTQNQASGACYGIWENAKKSETIDNLNQVRKMLNESEKRKVEKKAG